MDTIKNYLESMFRGLPQTAKVLKAKKELGQMMEDKYSELIKEGKSDNEAIGTVISEFGNLEELAADLGIDDVFNSSRNSNDQGSAAAHDEPKSQQNKSSGKKEKGKVKYKNRTCKTIMEVYWPTATCIYFALSFLTLRWGVTWMIWPLAGVFYPVLRSLLTVDEDDSDLEEK